MKNTRGVVIGMAAIVASVGLLPGAVRLHLSHRLPRRRRSQPCLQFTWPQPFALFDNLVAGPLGARLPDGHRVHQQRHPHRRSASPLMVIFSAMVAYVWQRRAARLNGVISLLVLAGPDRATRRRSHHLGAAEGRPVQDHARSDPDRDRLRAAVLHPAIPSLHGHGAAGTRTRPPSWTEPSRCRSSSG